MKISEAKRLHDPEKCVFKTGSDQQTYEILDGPSIRCLCCGMRSWHHEDVKQHYCGFCHGFHDDLRRNTFYDQYFKGRSGNQT